MPKVLIVDDETNIRKLYENDFSDAGFEVTTASTNEEALRRVASTSPDLVVLDIKLGAENGLDCLRQIKTSNPSIAVILNSGYSTYKDDFSSWLADAYVVKSGDTGELMDRARDLLEAKPVA